MELTGGWNVQNETADRVSMVLCCLLGLISAFSNLCVWSSFCSDNWWHIGRGKCCLCFCVFFHQWLCWVPWEHLLRFICVCNDPSRKAGVGPPQSPLTHKMFHSKWKTGCLWLGCVVAAEQSPLQGCRALAVWRRTQLLVWRGWWLGSMSTCLTLGLRTMMVNGHSSLNIDCLAARIFSENCLQGTDLRLVQVVLRPALAWVALGLDCQKVFQ